MRKSLALVLTALCSQGYAQDNFSGFSAELGVASRNFEGTTSDFLNNGAPVAGLSFNKIDKSKQLADIAFKYSWALTPNYYLGVAYERSLQTANLGQATGTFGGITFVSANSVKVSNMQSLVLSPGLKISPTTLLQLRLGYTTNTVKIAADGEPTDKIDGNGLLTGVGIQHAFNERVYLSANYDVFNMKDKSVSGVDSDGDSYSYKFKRDGSALRIGLGYRF